MCFFTNCTECQGGEESRSKSSVVLKLLRLSDAIKAMGGGETLSFDELPSCYSPWVHCMAGSVAGLAEHGLMYPIDFAKTRMMSFGRAFKSINSSILQAMREEGLFRPMRGISVVALSSAPAHGLYFASYELSKRLFSGNPNPSGKNFIANGTAGAVATLMHDCIMVPADTLKQQMQRLNSPHKSLASCVQTVMEQEGFRSLYRSYWTQVSMNIPFQVTQFIFYECFKDILSRGSGVKELTVLTHIASGAAAGALAAAVTNPFDVCKTLINTRECVGSQSSAPRGLREAVRLVWQQHGTHGFLIGVRARVLYVAPSTAISWAAYESLKKWLLTTHERELRRDPQAP